jgi:uncharacterized protein (TIGR02145 family)
VTSVAGDTVIERGICWDIQSAVSFTKNIGVKKTGSGSGPFVCEMSDLSLNTTYYVRAYAITSVDTAYGSTLSFKTRNGIISLTTTDISGITINRALSGGTITNNGGAPVTNRGLCWNTSGTPTIFDSTTTSCNGDPSFTCQVSGLSLNTTYYIRAYASNIVGTYYGPQKIFTTSNGIVTLSTTTPYNISINSAFSGGNITNDGGAFINYRGVCWNTTGMPTITDPKTASGMGIGSFTIELTGLSLNTVYYVRAYAINSVGVSYAPQMTFTTRNGIATLSTSSVSNITINSASSGGYISNNGGTVITARGICWNTTGSPTIDDYKTANGSGNGSFTSQLIGLSFNTVYYVRAYAINSVGVSYAPQIIFTTRNGIATLSTSSISNITINSASSGGNITDDGGSPITMRGICWNTNGSPTIDDLKTNDGGGNGSFASQLTGLQANTSYFIRAYAVNSAGVSYGPEINFRSHDGIPALLTTLVTNITSNSAMSGGNSITAGGALVSARGVCWNTTGTPTTNDNTTYQGSGLVDYTSNLSSLQPKTLYFLRAYATTIYGTGYGNEVSFTTNKIDAQSGILTINQITETTAVCRSEITNDNGLPVIARGVCWNTLPAPTVDHFKTTDGSGTGLYNSNLSGLNSNTLYYVRAYAENSDGISYSEEMIFKTYYESVTDIEGNKYMTTQIGTQVWLAENLRTTKYRDGSTIPNVTDNSAWINLNTPAYCWYSNNETNYKNPYGALYNWYAVSTGSICPSGWHIPTNEEWVVLINYLGGSGVAGGKLKEAGSEHWANPNSGATNITAFTGLPGGWRVTNYTNLGSMGTHWTSTESSPTEASYYPLGSNSFGISKVGGLKYYGLSVRCIKD